MSRGRFIVIEGIDGAGTTTQAQKLLHRFESEQISCMITAEPSQGIIGTLLRKILDKEVGLPGMDGGLNQEAMTLLFAADRLDHNAQVIQSALSSKVSVICDRYSLSTYAYQGGTEEVPDSWLLNADSHAMRPDIMFYLDIPVDLALDRIRRRGEVASIFEKKQFLQKVVSRYEERLSQLKAPFYNWYRIDGTKTPDAIAEEIWIKVQK